MTATGPAGAPGIGGSAGGGTAPAKTGGTVTFPGVARDGATVEACRSGQTRIRRPEGSIRGRLAQPDVSRAATRATRHAFGDRRESRNTENRGGSGLGPRYRHGAQAQGRTEGRETLAHATLAG